MDQGQEESKDNDIEKPRAIRHAHAGRRVDEGEPLASRLLLIMDVDRVLRPLRPGPLDLVESLPEVGLLAVRVAFGHRQDLLKLDELAEAVLREEISGQRGVRGLSGAPIVYYARVPGSALPFHVKDGVEFRGLALEFHQEKGPAPYVNPFIDKIQCLGQELYLANFVHVPKA